MAGALDAPMASVFHSVRPRGAPVTSIVGHICRMTKPLSCLLISVTLMGCGREKVAMPSSTAPVHVARPDTPLLICWFVESDGHGRHGYTALDGRISSWNPEAWPLFKSIADLRATII